MMTPYGAVPWKWRHHDIHLILHWALCIFCGIVCLFCRL